MTLNSIRLQNFRSYRDSSFEFDAGVNIIVGPNASGKTNLLEAILVLMRGSSYRVSDSELIMFNKPWARLDASFVDKEERTIKLEPKNGRAFKSYIINGKSLTRLSHHHVLPAVLFEPNHLNLLSGQPEARRNYLDDLLEQAQAGFGATRRHYKRVLSQRNSLLKRRPKDLPQQLFVWNVRLSELGGHIARSRAELTERLNKQLPKVYQHIAQTKTKVHANYQAALPLANYETMLLKKLEASLDQDLQRGFTLSGPHREDLAMTFDGQPAQDVASRGEIRTALLALKIFELNLLESTREQKPLLLLDDVFSELDGKRRHALTDFLKDYQTFITTTDADLVTHTFAQSANLIALE